jgi:hypothetical protein
MGHGPCTFKEADVKRAVKAVAAAGQPVQGVRFYKDGGFMVVTGEQVKLGDGDVTDGEARAVNPAVNPLDKMVKDYDPN